MCGENRRLVTGRELEEGSPPRVRGKLCRKYFFRMHSGITPACAGKTEEAYELANEDEDHPRVCGENRLRRERATTLPGSPPRVRGKLARSTGKTPTPGITPACAGKTTRNGRRAPRSEDHPRVCGENAVEAAKKALSEGSPPRVRGKQEQLLRIDDEDRITPACAGKTR